MSKELSVLDNTESIKDLLSYMPEHNEMLCKIESSLPEITRATSLFNKTQSQFMDNMLTVSHPTPLRNIRQILAEMNKTKEALKESHLKCKKKKIEIQIKERELSEETDELKSSMLKIEIMELESQLESTMGYVSGAIRKLANYTEQYDSILNSMNVKDFNEIDFEKEEERFHIMKAFDQAITAARAKGGLIDEGNSIYLNQIGINVAAAQRDITSLFAEEEKIFNDGKEPTHQMILNFLNAVAEKYAGCSTVYAVKKGMTGKITEHAALKTGDTRLFNKG